MNDHYKFFSVEVQITNRCNYLCKECINNSGIYRMDAISSFVIKNIIEKLGCQSDKLIISGGEPMLYMDILKKLSFLWKNAGKDKGGERKVYLKTNCFWADTEKNVEKMLRQLKKYEIDKIILPVKNRTNIEFVSEENIKRVMEINDRRHLIGQIVRENIIEKSKLWDVRNNIKTNKIFINVFGDIQFCKEAYICYLGSIQDDNYLDIFEYEFLKILSDKGLKDLVQEYNLKFNKNIVYNAEQNECQMCRYITSEWKRQI